MRKIVAILFLLLIPTVALGATCQQIEQFLAGWTDNSNQPLASGKVYTYAAGTTTPQSLYTDKDCTTPETNPVILDSNGRKQVYANSAQSYKFVIKTSADVTLYTLDNLFYPRELYLTNSSGLLLYNSTSDGSDNQRIGVGGGGASGAGRGAELLVHGNESAGNAGRAILATGNAASAPLDLLNQSSTGDIRFFTNSVSRWQIDGTTNAILPEANESYDLGSSAARVDDAFIKTLGASGSRVNNAYVSTLDVTTITNPYATWTPSGANYTLTDGTGPMAWSVGPTFPASSYHTIGKTVFMWHYFFGTFSGTAEKTINFPPPVNATSLNESSCWGSYEYGASTEEAAFVKFTSTSNIIVQRKDQADWPIGSSVQFRVGCIYATP